MKQAASTLTLLAGGDVGPVVKPVDRFAEKIIPVIRQADIRFVQCERTYSRRGWPPQFAYGPPGHTRLDTDMASIFKKAKIDVVSLASNHAMDWGPEPMLDTVKLLSSMGIKVIGAGRNEKEARRPAVVEKKGIKIAILAYCSVLRDGQAAGPGKAGVAPMRAHTYYEPGDFQPGSPPKIITVPFEEDLMALEKDIRRAKAHADAVILSLHWGVRYIPKVIATYQPQVAHAAIDAGADLILGHHPNVLRGIEVYKGKVCFYSIGNFMTTGSRRLSVPTEWNLFWWKIEPESLYKFSIESKKTMLVKVLLSKKGVERVSFLPTFINNRAQPESLNRKDERFQEILDHVEWVSDQFPHRFKVEGDEVVVQSSV
ncbi:MAG: CapA family protein [Thermodesulfobacteriota bacterium]|nr:CapA family protein [Thermodesulfobacteriota bacterium]